VGVGRKGNEKKRCGATGGCIALRAQKNGGETVTGRGGGGKKKFQKAPLAKPIEKKKEPKKRLDGRKNRLRGPIGEQKIKRGGKTLARKSVYPQRKLNCDMDLTNAKQRHKSRNEHGQKKTQ